MTIFKIFIYLFLVQKKKVNGVGRIILKSLKMWSVPFHPLPSTSLTSTQISIPKALGIWQVNVDQTLAGWERGQEGQFTPICVTTMQQDKCGDGGLLSYCSFLCPFQALLLPPGLYQVFSLWINLQLFLDNLKCSPGPPHSSWGHADDSQISVSPGIQPPKCPGSSNM